MLYWGVTLTYRRRRSFYHHLDLDVAFWSSTRTKGHYRALEWSEARQEYVEKPELGIIVEVEVHRPACSSANKWTAYDAMTIFLCFSLKELATNEVMVKTTGPPDGRFTFTSHGTGDHSICLSTNYTSWFASTHIRLYLDIVVGSAKPDVEQDRSHVNEVAGKIRDLNQKLEDIRREQQYQREREANYRNLSEGTNARAVWYSLAQIAVLIATCIWQLRHLKVCGNIFYIFYEKLTQCPRTSLRIEKWDRILGSNFAPFYNSQYHPSTWNCSKVFLPPLDPRPAIMSCKARVASLSDSLAFMETISCSGAANYENRWVIGRSDFNCHLTNLLMSHQFGKILDQVLYFLISVTFIPPSLPETMSDQIFEDEGGCGDGERVFGHSSIGDEMSIFTQRTKHMCCIGSSWGERQWNSQEQRRLRTNAV